MEEFRTKVRDLVTYILDPKDREEDIIENYTNSVMLACEEYKNLNTEKLYKAVRYMIDVWDEVTGNTWRKSPDHVQKKFLEAETQLGDKGKHDSFESVLRVEFLLNTQNYPKEYHELVQNKFKRAERRYEEQFNGG